MLEVFKPEALNYFTFSHPILLTLSVSRNPILTPLSLSGFLVSLLCVLIALTPGLAFSLVIPRTLAAVSSFLSGRAYLSLNFLPPLFSSLDLYSDYVGFNIFINNSFSLSFLNVNAPPIFSSLTNGRSDSFCPSILSSSRNLFILGTSTAITPSGTQEVLPTPTGTKYSTGSSPLTSSATKTLTYQPFAIAPLAVAPLLTSPLLHLLLFFLVGGASAPGF